MESQGWASCDEIKRFYESMSHPDASGDEAVHAHPKQALYFQPMPIAEARSFLTNLLNKWLDWKQSQQ